MIGYQEAFHLIQTEMSRIDLRVKTVALLEATGLVAAQDVTATVDSPSVSASLKDGYAVHSTDVASASVDQVVELEVVGVIRAGDGHGEVLPPGKAVRVTTGAPLPPGADAVLAEEFTRRSNNQVLCFNNAHTGRNVLPRGMDVKQGECIASKGDRLHPARIGLLAAGGVNRLDVIDSPRIGVIATGDEVVEPGEPLSRGKLYASNLVETASWLKTFGMADVEWEIVPDQIDAIRSAFERMLPRVDGFISSGGAWKSDRDLMDPVLGDLGWQKIFHRLRLGPGKAAGFGLLAHRPVFILPGGPPSHEAAFLTLALPGLLTLAGRPHPPFATVAARLEETVRGEKDWTQVLHGKLLQKDSAWIFSPLKSPSRLRSMEQKNALFLLPEGTDMIASGETVHVWNLGLIR